MSCFIKKVFEGKTDEGVHSQFVRFGRGNYAGRAVISLMKTSKVKVKASFEYADDFVNLVSELTNVKFSGIVLSKNELNLNGKKKSGIYEYEFSGSSEDVKKIKDKTYFMLLDGEGDGISLKIKKKLPKPGKAGEGKIDAKFCILEADLKYYSKIKDEFFWDIPDCKRANITHTYEINDLVMPKNEKDFEKIRVLTKRKGKIIRKIVLDKDKESVREAELEA